jgi:hypothetical protein
MISFKSTEEVIYLTNGKEVVCFQEKTTDTQTVFGTKTVFTITVFHTPMAETIEAVSSRIDQAPRKYRMERAAGILNHIESLVKTLINARFQKQG